MRGERFTFFHGGPFTQWYRSAFVIDGVAYVTAEQWMMAEKARLFGDREALGKILATGDPRRQKALGRSVRGFIEARWAAMSDRVVFEGNRAKFVAQPALLALLLDTAGTTLVEASPRDRIWGIGWRQITRTRRAVRPGGAPTGWVRC